MDPFLSSAPRNTVFYSDFSGYVVNVILNHSSAGNYGLIPEVINPMANQPTTGSSGKGTGGSVPGATGNSYGKGV